MQHPLSSLNVPLPLPPVPTAYIPASLSASVFTHTFKVGGLSDLIPRGRGACPWWAWVSPMVPDTFLFTLAAHGYGVGAAACAYMGMTAALVKMGQLEGWKVFAEPRV